MTEHVDVLVIGAGLSGIGAACQLRRRCPDKRVLVLEAREAIGGTWDLFRYPGVRSDSDMFTLGYSFAPWTGDRALADGPSIREYIRRTAREFGVDGGIRFGHRAVRAEWSSDRAQWTVETERCETGETVRFTCSFLFANTGYYRYDEGYTPRFPGAERFTGTIVHPQHWPEGLDYRGKRIVVIGSGATAVTLVPALTDAAEHVTMLQRSPSYVLSLPAVDEGARRLFARLPSGLAYRIVRWKHILIALVFFQLSRRRPASVRRHVRRATERLLPDDHDVDVHFKPDYAPWDQRVCFVPDGDLFAALRAGSASMVTDTVASFTERGIALGSGYELDADIVVTATGLNLELFGGMELLVDGKSVRPGRSVSYKGMMLSGVPNFAMTIGYTNASWTLKADLVAGYVCRLLRYMDAGGYRSCTPIPPESVTPSAPLVDLQAGYVLRSADRLPKQGPAPPWRLFQNYLRDLPMMRHGRIADGAVRFD